MQGTNQPVGSNLGVRCLAQGHFDTPRAGDRTGNPPTAGQPLLHPLLPPELRRHNNKDYKQGPYS
uniref:Uncharacterized protein n=1 Tax=Anguilla anguilla TaxID=7936 RepID=A0A0E9TSQ5_ANGAN